MFNDKSFFEKFPKDVYEVCVYISRQGFCLTLVGGAVRDFLKDDTLSHDLDFEIKHLFEYSEERWERMLKRMFEGLKNDLGYEVEHKGLNVFSIKTSNSELEFSSPRLEEFDLEDKSHKNFSPKYISNLETAKAFLRRDFTINAIGIYFGVSGASDEFTILDPFNGVQDLEKNILKHVGKDFSKDPVRLLRLIRFKNRFKLNLSKETELILQDFDLSKVSAHYIQTEFFKLNDLVFFKELFEIIDSNQIVVDKNLLKLRVLGQVDINASLVKFSTENFLEWLCFHKDIQAHDKKQIVEYFGMSQKLADKFVNALELFLQLDESKSDTYTEFFKAFFALELKSEANSKWFSFKDLWIRSLKTFRPSSKASAKVDREEFLKSLTETLLTGK
jgi:tRNA nucleotidyltransferase (CCA-adding enzyme)